MHGPHRVEQMGARLAFKRCDPVTDFSEPKAHRLRDRRLRKTAVDNRLQYLLAGHSGDLFGPRHPVSIRCGFLHDGLSLRTQLMYMHIMRSDRMQPRKSLGTDAVEVTAVCAGWNTRLASRRITQFLESRMAGSGLTLAQFGLMAQIAGAFDDTLGALAERSGLDQSSLSRNLHALERDGMVEIAIVERDLRTRAVWHRGGSATPGRSNTGLA